MQGCSYIPQKKTPLVPYSCKAHVAGVAILIGVTVVAAIAIGVSMRRGTETIEQQQNEGNEGFQIMGYLKIMLIKLLWKAVLHKRFFIICT